MKNQQGRIFKRGAVWWIGFQIKDPKDLTRTKEHRESTGVKVETENPPREVVQRLKSLTAKTTLNEFIPDANKVTFDDLVKWVNDDYLLNGRNTETPKYNQANLRPFFSRFPPVNYTPGLVKLYQTERIKAGASIATVNREVSQLSHMLNIAVQDGYLPQHKKFKKLDGEKPREGFLTPADFYKILEKLKGWKKDFIEFAYLTGWRSGKVKELEWKHVYLNNVPPIIIPPQGSATKKSGGKVPLTGRLMEIIKAREAARSPTCLYVFHNAGHKISNIRYGWYRACIKAGYMPTDKSKRIYIHDFRRSFARNMSEAGVSPELIMERAGWNTTSVFQRYRIVTVEDQMRATEKLENYIEESLKQTTKVEKIG